MAYSMPSARPASERLAPRQRLSAGPLGQNGPAAVRFFSPRAEQICQAESEGVEPGRGIIRIVHDARWDDLLSVEIEVTIFEAGYESPPHRPIDASADIRAV